MNYNQLKEPKEVSLKSGRVVAIGKMPALGKGYEIYQKILKAENDWGKLAITMLGDDSMKDMLQFVAIRDKNGDWACLDTTDKINDNMELFDIIETVLAIREINFGFFGDGRFRSALHLEEAEADFAS